jgi:hypothetical protein
MEQRATNDNASTVVAKVSETGLAELSGLPSNVSGLAKALVKLRDTYAPNVLLAYHLSVWGTLVDIGLSNPSDAEVDRLAARAAASYRSLAADFDACDAHNDGVTNPSPIGGNTLASELAPLASAPVVLTRGTTPTLVTPYAANDDGGFFRWRAWKYYQDGAMTLSTFGVPPSAPTDLRVVH